MKSLRLNTNLFTTSNSMAVQDGSAMICSLGKAWGAFKYKYRTICA